MHNKRFLIRCGPDTMHRASQLALQIYARVPLIPRSLFLNGENVEIDNDENLEGFHNGILTNGKHKIKIMFWPVDGGIFVCYHPFLMAQLVVMSRKPFCQMALIFGSFSHENVHPFLGVYEGMAIKPNTFFFVTPYIERNTLRKWRQSANPSGLEIRNHVSLISNSHG